MNVQVLGAAMHVQAATRTWQLAWPFHTQTVMHDVHVQARKADGNKDTERFITARGTQQMWRIGWSFYAGAVSALRMGLIGQAASRHCLSLGLFKACLPQTSVHMS